MSKTVWLLFRGYECDCCTPIFKGVFASERDACDYLILQQRELPYLEVTGELAFFDWEIKPMQLGKVRE